MTERSIADQIAFCEEKASAARLNAVVGEQMWGKELGASEFLREEVLFRSIAQTLKQSQGVKREIMYDLVAHLRRQREFSAKTFGPGPRTSGVVDHIRKELNEIEAHPEDLSEWIDVVLLAFDGAWRRGYAPETIADALVTKQARNESRQWPDWRTLPTDKVIEHIRAVEVGPRPDPTPWQDISTAPMDGTKVLLWDGFDVTVGSHQGGGFIEEFTVEALCYEKPIAWMALPVPPERPA